MFLGLWRKWNVSLDSKSVLKLERFTGWGCIWVVYTRSLGLMTSARIFKGKKKGLERLEGAKGYHDF